MTGEESILLVQEWSIIIFVVGVLAWLAWTLFRPREFTLDWDEYTANHPDLCIYMVDCKTWGVKKCHHLESHRKCEIFRTRDKEAWRVS